MIRRQALIGISEKDEIATNELVEFIKIISDANRFKIIQLLFINSEVTVGDLSVFMDISQPAVSQHLKILKLSCIVMHSKRGRRIYYSLDFEGLRRKYGQGINYLRQYFLKENN